MTYKIQKALLNNLCSYSWKKTWLTFLITMGIGSDGMLKILFLIHSVFENY